MSLGVVMLIHEHFGRAEKLLRHWVAGGCPVVVHIDQRVSPAERRAFQDAVSDIDEVRFAPSHRCEWGSWGLVAATQAASEMMLAEFPSVRHVFLASGACLPLRPLSELKAYLAAHPRTDFIESVTTADVPWAIGGLDKERFTLRFPFSWRKNRRAFDRYVALQRRLKMKRKIPARLNPHMGSQWWCLTRDTLSAILNDPERRKIDRYFRMVWIPDESYFQTLARLYSRDIDSRSLTLSKFDHQGKPHIFYDDHVQLLRRSDCFVARKVWHRADVLFETFLKDEPQGQTRTEPNPAKIDRVFRRASDRRLRGRPGLFMHSRYPHENWTHGRTAAPYSVFEGCAEVFPDFPAWLERTLPTTAHGHLYDPDRVHFSGGQSVFAGALSDNPTLRDYDPVRFLSNLIWNTRDSYQSFQFGPRDTQKISWEIAKDPNARITVVSGAWILPLMRSKGSFTQLRDMAARLQKIESDHIFALRSPYAKGQVRIHTLAEFLEAPRDLLKPALDDIAPDTNAALPPLADLSGLPQFLRDLKNQGMHPYLMGDVSEDIVASYQQPEPARPYLVKR